MGQYEEMPFSRLSKKQKQEVVNNMKPEQILEQKIEILPKPLPPPAPRISMPYIIAIINEQIAESSGTFVRVMKVGIFLNQEQKQFLSQYYRDAGWVSAKFADSQAGMIFELEAE